MLLDLDVEAVEFLRYRRQRFFDVAFVTVERPVPFSALYVNEVVPSVRQLLDGGPYVTVAECVADTLCLFVVLCSVSVFVTVVGHGVPRV